MAEISSRVDSNRAPQPDAGASHEFAELRVPESSDRAQAATEVEGVVSAGKLIFRRDNNPLRASASTETVPQGKLITSK